MTRKLIFFVLIMTVCLGGIGYLFWKQEYKFTLPTPVPADLVQLHAGDSVRLPITADRSNLFIHFFNYDCPCSRFNIAEFQSMVRRYADEVEFVAVLQTDDSDRGAVDAFMKKYDLGIRVIEDPEGDIASSLGVYSTPQAVIIKDNRLFYKGNYNRARFCLSRNTKFAELALQALINNQPPPDFPEFAFVAYGCELPVNSADTTQSSLFSFF